MADESWTREYQDGELVPGTPYKVVNLLGAGGMGSVYVVEHVELERKYVLKSLLRSLATREDLIQRMRNEWRALGKLHNPNIVDVINAGATPDGVPYYVMELLTGETVRDRLARLGPFSPEQAVRVAQATLVGLAAAHAIGVVHRDIKPANVFLTRDGAVKVLDFGIAQVRLTGAPKITAQGLAIGTPRYMSPEQASGEQADARSDVYAVGLLLYEMLAGEGPFDDLSDITQQMLAHLHRPPRPLSLWVHLPDPLVDIIERALAKNPDDRPRTAEYLAAELAPFAGGDGPIAPGSVRASHVPPLPPSSPTPSGIVLNTRPPQGVVLNPAWRDATVERGSEPPRRASRPSPEPRLSTPPPFARPRRRGLAVGLVALLVASAGIATFGFGPLPRTISASTDANASPAVHAPSPNAAPTPPPAPANAIPGTMLIPGTYASPEPASSLASAITPDGKVGAKKRKKPAKAGASTSAPDDPVRLPPSGL